jgi:hypothetical protein
MPPLAGPGAALARFDIVYFDDPYVRSAFGSQYGTLRQRDGGE